MSQLLYKNLQLTKPNNVKYLFEQTVRHINTKPFTSFPQISFLRILRQTLINNQKLFQFAKNIFFDKTNLLRNKLKNVKNNFKINDLKLNKKLYALSFSTAGLFSWDDYSISDTEVKTEINDVLTTFKISEENRKINFEQSRNFQDAVWEKIYDKKDLIIWRRKITIEEEPKPKPHEQTVSNELYEYKVLGRINDVTPIEFYQTQIDLNFRKQWDYLVIFIEMIDKDPVSHTELIRWCSKFPYPLYAREYVFVRRYCIELNEKLMILISRAVPEFDMSNFKLNNKDLQSVRVTQYKSNMIIIPHNDFDKPGLDYVMQYYDVNKANIPKMAYKWMASSGLPDYIDKLHKATLQLKKINQKLNKNNLSKDLLSKFQMFDLKAVSDASNETDSKSGEPLNIDKSIDETLDKEKSIG